MAYRRLLCIFVIISLCSITLLVRTANICDGALYSSAAQFASSRTLTVYAQSARGNIYDCNMKILNNTDIAKNAVIMPTQESIDMTASYAADFDEFYSGAMSKKPFCTKITYGDFFCDKVHVFNIASQDDDNRFLTHLLGYYSDNSGICGLEYAFDDILKAYSLENSVTYSTNGNGMPLAGIDETVIFNKSASGGIVTTIDSDFQQICLDAAKGRIEKGAIVVMDITNGDIKAMASFPTYSYSEIEDVMYNEDSPMINRALYSYSVGSIFKLVIAAAAIDSNLEDFTCECKGYTNIGPQIFKCHDIGGHGMQDMTMALVNSCNPYFIELSSLLDAATLRSYALAFGFGERIQLAKSISSMPGVLPDVRDLLIPAEKANFSFGQGYLSATPLAICRMTCGIAAFGEMPKPRLYLGTTDDGENIDIKNKASYSYCVNASTARKLRDFMDAVVNDNENSLANAYNTNCAAKTSTAQTGRYDENQNEYCHAWITGYFPSQKPQYAVTVLVENGGYGNEAAAPVFRYIAEEITQLEALRAQNEQT